MVHLAACRQQNTSRRREKSVASRSGEFEAGRRLSARLEFSILRCRFLMPITFSHT